VSAGSDLRIDVLPVCTIVHKCGGAPYLQANWDLGRWLNVRSVLSSAVVYTCDGKGDVQNEHDLSFVNDL
jgi:hypothetical protein